jgi:APA family basic amino acid/polyamine antiporter
VSSSPHRRLGTADAVALGLAAMVGTGVFAVWGPAAAAAGPWLLLAVVLAGIVATCNAASVVDLALAHPTPGDGYGFGRDRLSPAAGRLAGLALLVGKWASAAAAAGVFGSYVLPSAPNYASVLVIVAATALNLTGVRCTDRGAYALVGGTLVVLLLVVVVGLIGGGGDPAAAPAASVPVAGGVLGTLTAAGLVFFAFAGFERIAALGGEVRDPDRTLRRAVAVALGVALVGYLLVVVALLVGLGAAQVAGESAPLVAVVDSGYSPGLGVLVRVGAAVATGSALLSVLIDVSRTALDMARRGDLPRCLKVIGPKGTPWRADLIGGLGTVALTAVAGPAAAIALSACSALVYYAVINLAALRLPAATRRLPRWTAVVGFVMCLGLAVLLPSTQVLIAVAVLAVCWTACTVLPRRRA